MSRDEVRALIGKTIERINATTLVAKTTVVNGTSERTFYLYRRDNGGFQEWTVHTRYHNQPGLGDGGYHKTYSEALEDFITRVRDELDPYRKYPDDIGEGLPLSLMQVEDR